jgi:hypothetical protein
MRTRHLYYNAYLVSFLPLLMLRVLKIVSDPCIILSPFRMLLILRGIQSRYSLSPAAILIIMFVCRDYVHFPL